jgi:pimeloyl-ACP methyl ester carboxylesterase
MRPSFLRRLVTGAAIIFTAGFVASWFVGSLLMRATPAVVAQAAAPARDLRLVSGDGLTLAATYWPGRTGGGPAVLLLHGNGASRAALAGNAEWLARHGYAAMTLDLRGHGESHPAAKSFGFNEAEDAAAALDWLRREGHRKVGVVGVSLGGASALIGEDGPLPADALVLQAVYPDIRRAIGNRIAGVTGRPLAHLLEPLLSFQSRLRLGVPPSRLSPIAAVPRFRGAVWVVGGDEDGHTPPEETRALYAAARAPKTLWIAPGLDHVQISEAKSPEYRRRLLAFFDTSIGPP